MIVEKPEVWHLARPLGDRVWGYPVYAEPEEVTESGLILTKTITPRKVQMTLNVIRIGPDVKDVKEGDTVILDINGNGEAVTLIDDAGEAHSVFAIKEKYISLVLNS